MELLSPSKKPRIQESNYQSNMNDEAITNEPILEPIPKDNAKPLMTVELANPGIGDSTYIYRDNYLRHGLSQFPASSYDLELIVDPAHKIKVCGGYDYLLKINTHQSEIQQFITEWHNDKNLDKYRYIPQHKTDKLEYIDIDPSKFVDLDEAYKF
ncbi:MAG: hypothetical protein WD512_11605 [Candidatus Paceibacterota bacterium]